MAYDPTIWADNVTPISATNLNKIEQAVFNNDTLLVDIAPKITWEKIAEQTPVSAVAQVDFASIPSGYKYFRLMINGISSTSATQNGLLRFNDDAGLNYAIATSMISSIIINNCFMGSVSGSTPSFGYVEIANYPLIKKRVIGHVINDTGAPSVTIGDIRGVWYNQTTEINKISLAGQSTLIGIGSRFVLWGCK